MMGKECKRCGYVRTAGDNAPEYECPKCGIVYAKIEDAARKEPEMPEAWRTEDAPRMFADTDVYRPSSPASVVVPASVRIVDIDMKFWSMVWFMVKWAIATIPAVIILIFVGVMVFGFVGGLTGSTHSPKSFSRTYY